MRAHIDSSSAFLALFVAVLVLVFLSFTPYFTQNAAGKGAYSGMDAFVDEEASGSSSSPPQSSVTLSPSEYVDVFVGTKGDSGQLHPAAMLPFGMVQLGPDTTHRRLVGYSYEDTALRGFSHTRLQGVGCQGAGAQVRIRPGIGDPSDPKYQIPMDKRSEVGSPGYYAVSLGGDHRIRAEMTVAKHTGFHSYTFPNRDDIYLFMVLNDPLEAHKNNRSYWEFSDSRDEISGWVSGGTVCEDEVSGDVEGTAREYKFYFSAKLSRPYAEAVQVLNPAASPVTGGSGANHFDYYLLFDKNPQSQDRDTIMVKVGLSTVSIEDAKSNRDQEVPDWDFGRVREQAVATWDEYLGRVLVNGSLDDKRLFYTMLYRAFGYPADITSVNGQYRDSHGVLQQAQGYTRYHGWSIWDTYKTKYPLFSLVAPAEYGDMAHSLVDMYSQGLPDDLWATNTEPYPSVRVDGAPLVLLDAYGKGIATMDLSLVRGAFYDEYEQAKSHILSPVKYVKHSRDNPGAKMEVAQEIWALSALVGMMNVSSNSTYDSPGQMLGYADGYRRVWHEYFRDPNAIEDSDRIGKSTMLGLGWDSEHPYGLYEGTIWQWRWAPQFDIQGLVLMKGGQAALRGELDQYFVEDKHFQANEVSFHTPYLYAALGEPWKTQYRVRDFLTQPTARRYTNPKGPIDGGSEALFRLDESGFQTEMDDDLGAMSSWYVLSAMGLYPISPGMPYFALTTPLFDEVTIVFANDTNFTIVANGLPGAVYIDSATLNGVPYDKPWILYDDIRRGGLLSYNLSATPTPWGSGIDAIPPNGFSYFVQPVYPQPVLVDVGGSSPVGAAQE